MDKDKIKPYTHDDISSLALEMVDNTVDATLRNTRGHKCKAVDFETTELPALVLSHLKSSDDVSLQRTC